MILKKFLQLAIFMSLTLSFAQLGVGTNSPNASAQLDVTATDKGTLITRIALTSTTDASTIANGNVESMMVFNTSSVADVTPGYYYWSSGQWHKIATVPTVSKRVGEFIFAKSSDPNKTAANGYLAVVPGTIANGAIDYPVWAAQYPEFVSGNDIVFPADVEGMFLRNTGGLSAGEGSLQTDATARPNTNFTTNTTGNHTHSLSGTYTRSLRQTGSNTSDGQDNTSGEPDVRSSGTPSITASGNHSHSITGGGDAETRPQNRAYQLYTIVDTY